MAGMATFSIAQVTGHRGLQSHQKYLRVIKRRIPSLLYARPANKLALQPHDCSTLKFKKMSTNLTTNEALQAACNTAVEVFSAQESYQSWLPNLTQHIRDVISVEHDEFVSKEFQQKLWNGEAISAIGQGNIDVSQVLTNKEIVERLWELKATPLPEQPSERIQFLFKAWEDCLKLVGPLVKRTPLLKMYRVFAALKPTEFTTIAHETKLRVLARAMGIKTGNTNAIEVHRRVLDRLTEVLGPTPAPPQIDGVKRMTLPWILFASMSKEQGDEATSVMGALAGSEKLIPLPADRRRRGMLAIGGSLPSIRSMIEFAKDGCTREDFKEHVRSINPKLSPASVGLNLNALIAEWGVLHATGDSLQLTQRGEAFLQTGNPEEVSDWLLTRILGFDNLLYKLREEPARSAELLALLKQVNPGWTSTFAPSALIGWARSLGLVEQGADKLYRLTEDGNNWAARIHWTPEQLQAVPKQDSQQVISHDQVSTGITIIRPSLQSLIDSLPASTVFAPSLIGRLDAGLWNNERRHFAVLTGLSGAGKTLLARHYALALWANADEPKDGLFTLPVQPGWHDPSSLLGYVNPLSTNTYVRTVFLDFLMRASGDPTRPYTVVLDEMNLSHPEQYLAPLLSAMETGDDIELHPSDEEISGVPPRIPYPNNLVLIGTINMDETTHGLSDKILDRASVIEFWDVDVHAYPGWNDNGLDAQVIAQIRTVLADLGSTLRPVRLHFGWRTIGDILGYVRSAQSGGVLDSKAALDHAIFGKVLPKLRGEDTPRLREAFANALKVLKAADLIESSAKLEELADDLKHTGSARFWR